MSEEMRKSIVGSWESDQSDDSVSLADLLDANRHKILDRYRAELNKSGSTLLARPETEEQVTANADQILSDVIESLRVGQVRIDSHFKVISREIGLSRAADGTHPRESLHAASIFFRTALSVAANLIEAGGLTSDQFVVVALALERSIAARVRESVAAYTSYLLDRVHEVQSEERRRIARELHDRIGHGLSVTHRQLELYDVYRSAEPVRAAAKVAVAQRANLESMTNLRALAADLHPRETVQGLHKALLRYLETADTERVLVRLHVNGDEKWADVDVLDQVFLILREAAHNSLRHAGALTLAIGVDIAPLEIRASVVDDGAGFEPDLRVGAGGVGLSSMYERARLLDGTVLVRSGPGKGTQVDVYVPLRRRVSDGAG